MSLAFLLLTIGSASAHGPTPQKVDEKIEISAPPSAVWNIIKDFGSIAKWHPGVSNAKTSAEGHAEGTTRTITLKSGGDLLESLDDYNDKDMNYTYRLATENVDVFPVSFYSDTISVQPAGSGSEVEWISRLYRADTTNEPPPNKNDAAAVKATTDFLKAGLAGIKAKAEGKG
jgi:mxaD protein